MAFTLCPDPEQQRAVFQELGGRAAEWAIRDRFTGEKMKSTHAAAQYVGLDAYEQAGRHPHPRPVFRDGRLAGPPRRPAADALAGRPEARRGKRPGCGPKAGSGPEVLIDYDYQTLAEFDRFTPPAPEPTADEAEKLAAPRTADGRPGRTGRRRRRGRRRLGGTGTAARRTSSRTIEAAAGFHGRSRRPPPGWC